ncbi:MAG TPA: histidine triad nucleotide-binding protein [Anaeromyxobacteraceae bacterium]|nr:histidine triad nucleotide-binding protein [Anaeromyxobacteraceae bacterium]
MADCLFCKIVNREIPAKFVHEDAEIVAFEDVNPQAPVHVLVIPRKHVPTLNDLAPEDDALMGRLVRTAAEIARQRGVDQSGWRAVVNVNKDANQLVFHVHLHLIGGRPMGWPPG